MGEPTQPEAADLAVCQAMIRTGSKSFHAAGRLLPADLRAAAHALYAFCRLSDDAVDGEGGSLAAVERLKARLAALYAGRPSPHPADRALAATVAAYALPKSLLDALMEGLAWDAEGRRYETLAELEAYAARVAGAVGALMAALMGARTPDMAARACDLGLAMQYTNIARDVGEDARAGRIYLPLAWLREAGLDPEAFLADPKPSPALAGVVRRLLAHADMLYARAEGAIARLPRGVRPAIFAARFLYAEIGREVERAGGDSVTRRAATSGPRKALLLARAVAATLSPAPRLSALPAEPGVAFLVAALAPSAVAPAREGPKDIGWLVDLFSDLDRRRALPGTRAYRFEMGVGGP